MGAGDASQFTRNTVKVGDLSISYLKGGHGQPLLYLHGLTGWGRWETYHLALGITNLVYAPQLPGWSDGQIPPSLVSVADYARLMVRCLDGLGIRQFDLVGHSFGGAIAFKLATSKRYVRCVRSLTLIEPVLPSILLEHEPDRPFYESFARESERICTPIWLGDKERGLQQFLTFWNGHVCWENLSRNRKAAFAESKAKTWWILSNWNVSPTAHHF